MRLFLYYISHSLFNTIKKLMKTWVAAIIIMLVFGFAVGLISNAFASSKKGGKSTSETTIEQVESGVGGENSSDGSAKDDKEDGGITQFMKKHGLSREQTTDIVISAVFLIILATNILNAQNSSKIFLPADVPMLFSSPMRPQSVLMFRLLCTLGSSLLVSVFMLFQLPNLIINVGFGFWAAVSLIVVYSLILVFSTLVQVVFYTITSKMKTGTGNIKNFLAFVYGAVFIGFAAYTFINKLDFVKGAYGYFANPKTHWVPFWGWLRGISYYAVTGDSALSLMYLGLFIVSCGVLVLVIWKLKADFYEDAMFAAEHKAEQLESVRNAAKGAVVTREKERKGAIDREGYHYGRGANVFFFKAVYNRFRFAKLKILSTTTIVYTIIAGVAAWFARQYTDMDPYFIPAVVLGVAAFYRTLGDPIREDTTRDFFFLVPEKHYSKILYSLLGSIAVTAIDLIIPMIVAAVILGSNPLSVIAWLIFILSVSFFATVVGTIISLSLPKDQAPTLSMVVQMIFFYFGITPSASAVLVGFFTGHLIPAILIGAAINIGIGFALSPILPKLLGRK